MICSVYWNDKVTTGISSIFELGFELDFISSIYGPTVAIIEDAKSGDALSIGLGGTCSVLTFLPSSPSHSSMISCGFGDPEQREGFTFMGEVSEFSGRNLVPVELAREAVREFFSTAKVPTEIEWEVS